MNKYFENVILLQNTLLPYFCDEILLKTVNKVFSKLNYEKFLTHLQPHGIMESYYPETKIIDKRITYKNGFQDGLSEKYHINGKLHKR